MTEPITYDKRALRTYDRTEVQARLEACEARRVALARQGAVISDAQIIMTRILAMCDWLFGDMDEQSRLAFESHLADVYETTLDATEPAARAAVLARGGMSPGGIVLPGTAAPR
jgi:hypothetical protein